MEPALHNSESAADLMNCPKCGYTQEKRLDCKKCGIVFSKYYAMYPDNRPADAAPATQSNMKGLQEQDFGPLLSDLEIQVNALSSRFNEVEFEKAERNQLRIDLKNMERQFHTKLDGIEERLVQCEKLFEQSQILQPRPVAADPAAVNQRLDQLEEKVESLDFAGQYVIELSEKNEANSRQMSDLQNQLAALQDEIAEIRTALDLVSQCLKDDEARTPLEEDVHIIRKNLDELRQFFSKHISS